MCAVESEGATVGDSQSGNKELSYGGLAPVDLVILAMWWSY